MDKRESAQTIELEDLEHVSGGEASTCVYASKTYTEGAVIKNEVGNNQTCSGGVWK